MRREIIIAHLLICVFQGHSLKLKNISQLYILLKLLCLILQSSGKIDAKITSTQTIIWERLDFEILQRNLRQLVYSFGNDSYSSFIFIFLRVLNCFNIELFVNNFFFEFKNSSFDYPAWYCVSVSIFWLNSPDVCAFFYERI